MPARLIWSRRRSATEASPTETSGATSRSRSRRQSHVARAMHNRAPGIRLEDRRDDRGPRAEGRHRQDADLVQPRRRARWRRQERGDRRPRSAVRRRRPRARARARADDLRPRHSGGTLDTEKVEDFLAHHESGIRVLLAPRRPDHAGAVTVEFLRELLDTLRQMADYVVVDTPPGFTPEVIAAIDKSTQICVVGDARLAVAEEHEARARDARADGVRPRASGRPQPRRQPGRRDPTSVELLGRAPDVRVPSDRDITRSVNEARPIVLVRRATPEARKAFRPRRVVHRAARSRTGGPAPEKAQAPRPSGRLWKAAEMELHERLRKQRTRAPTRTRGPVRRAQEPRPSVGDRGARPAAYQRTTWTRTALRSRVVDAIRPSSPTEQGLSRDDRERAGRGDLRRHARPRPARELLADPTVTEIMVNGPTRSGSSAKGQLDADDVRFTDDSHLRRIINKIVAPVGRRIDESSPMVDARLPDGSRVNAVIPPLRSTGPCSRSASSRRTRLDARGPDRARHVHPRCRASSTRCVGAAQHRHLRRHRLGQDDAAQRLSSAIPDDERIVTIEDAAELQLHQPHVVRSRRGRRTWRARAPSPSATSCGTRCACAPTASWSASAEAARRSTCCRR